MLLVFSLGFVNVVMADELPALVPDEYRGDGPADPSINDFVKIAINVSKIILGISGSLALLFFVYGGFMMIISSGSQERVTKAKTILTNAIIGLAIIFTSALIIMFVERMLKGE